MCGARLKRSIVPNSAAIYNFQRAFQLEQEEVSRACKPGARTGTKAELPWVVLAAGPSGLGSLVQPRSCRVSAQK